MRYTNEYIEEVLTYTKNNNLSQACKNYSIPRSTIRYWQSSFDNIKSDEIDFKIFNIDFIRAYNYVLGTYLGDGTISKHPRTYRLRVFQYSDYTTLIDKCVAHLSIIFPDNKQSFHIRKDCKCAVISVYNNDLPIYFPQHGIGKKHNRAIQLTEWQEALIKIDPESFICGLIDSDGCRFLQNYKQVYQFTNESLDIKEIFQWSCSLVDVKTTKPTTYKNVYVYKKADVDKLEQFYIKKQ